MTTGLLWAIISGFFCALTVSASVLYLRAVTQLAKRAALAPEWLQKRVVSNESNMQSLITSFDELRELVTVLANKVKMQRVRNVVAHSAGTPGDPDPYTDPDAWRAKMNRRLAEAKIARGGL